MDNHHIPGRLRFHLIAEMILIAMTMTLTSLAYAAGSPGHPQNPAAKSSTLRDPDLDALDAFLDSTPDVSKDVHQNPALLNDQNYISSHPGLAKFFQEHPDVREQARQNSSALLRQEQRWNNSGGDTNKWQVQVLDKFLDEHPQIDQDLRKNPKLGSDDAYIDKHPEFKAFLREHPGVRESLSEHPQMLMNRERQYERSEEKPR